MPAPIRPTRRPRRALMRPLPSTEIPLRCSSSHSGSNSRPQCLPTLSLPSVLLRSALFLAGPRAKTSTREKSRQCNADRVYWRASWLSTSVTRSFVYRGLVMEHRVAWVPHRAEYATSSPAAYPPELAPKARLRAGQLEPKSPEIAPSLLSCLPWLAFPRSPGYLFAPILGTPVTKSCCPQGFP